MILDKVMKFHSIKEPGQGQLPQEIPFFLEYSHKFDKFILLFHLFSIIFQIIRMAAFTLAGFQHIGHDGNSRFLLCKKREEAEKHWMCSTLEAIGNIRLICLELLVFSSSEVRAAGMFC